MKYDLIIIGAGPAGIFSALSLIHNEKMKLLMIDEGPDINQRKCPAKRGLGCINCTPCALLSGWGGAGAFSDGKLTLSTEVGGWLEDYCTKDKLVKLVNKEDDICTVTINRPEKRNALNSEIYSRLAEIFRSISEDGQTSVAVLRGAGEQAFSAGYEISRLHSIEDPDIRDPLEDVILAIDNCTVPVIAMIYGYCIAGGCALAIACDLRLAADNARLGITAAKFGLVYPPSAMIRLINVVGISASMSLPV